MLFIARRYLFSRRSHSVINIIAGVSLVSVATPVAAIIILLSIFNGFGSLVEMMNASVDADITISAQRGRYFTISQVDTMSLRGVEGVEALSLVSEQTVMLEHEGRESTVTLRGVDEDYASVVPIGEYMRSGSFQTHLGEMDRLVLGSAVAVKLGVRSVRKPEVNIYSLRESRLSSFVPMVDFVHERADVSGVYMLDMDSESRYAYTSLRLLDRLSHGEEVKDQDKEADLTSVVIRVADGYSAARLRERIGEIVGEEFRVQSREELNPMLYDIIRYERWGIIFISAMVMLLASFSLIGVVAMLIIEKRGDIETLRAMGATWGDVRNVFFMQGMLISGVGACAGLVVGVVVTLIQQFWGVVRLPAGGFVIEAYPVDLHVGDVVGVMIMSLGIAAVLNRVVTNEMIKK